MARPTHALPVSIPEVCQHCAEALCVENCISGALIENVETGAVELDQDRCVGCGSCIMACPYAAIWRDTGGDPVATKCDRCAEFRSPACADSCITGALRYGDDDALARDMQRSARATVHLVNVLVCVVPPVAGLLTGLYAADRMAGRNHALGIAAGALMAISFLLPFIGRWVSSLIKQSFWTHAHIVTGVFAATVALVHAAGRFGMNAQTVAVCGLGALLFTGVAYRHLRPTALMFAALLDREAALARASSAVGRPSSSGHCPHPEAVVTASHNIRAWGKLLHGIDALLAACRSIHIMLAIVTAGLVIAHVIVMTLVAGPKP